MFSSNLQNIGENKKWKKPDFICNEGRIVDSLIAPIRKSTSWEFYAVKYQDIIFISSLDFGKRGVTNIASHCGYIYRELITGGILAKS